MNIKSIVDNNFSTVFQGFEEAEREAQRKAVGYIMQLAAQTHTDISTWDLFEVFGQGNGRIYVAKPAINQRFFAKRDTQAPAEVQDIDKLVPALAERLMRPIARRRESIIRQAEQTRDQYINNAIGYFQRAEGYLKEAAKSHASAAAVDLLSAANATEEIVKVVKAGFWELVEAGKEDHRLHFITRSDCYLRHQNPAAGVDINLNMGKFRCSVDPAEAHVRVKGEGNNIRYAQYVHPHVSGNGEVCWGNAKDMVARDLPRLKLSGVLEALATILTNYNKDSPYIAIETMEQVVRRGPFIRCDDCGNNYWENEGACCTNEQTCYVCGSSYVEDDGRACECCYECENATCTCNEEEEDTGEDGIVEIAPQEEIVEAPSLSEAEAALRRGTGTPRSSSPVHARDAWR